MPPSANRPRHLSTGPKEDYYTVLGVRRDASLEQIAEAYRRMARKCHPDANPDDPQAERQFMKVQAAFEVLSDPAKRAAYDRTSISFATVRMTTKPGPVSSSYYQFPRKHRWERDPCAVDLIRWPAFSLLVSALPGLLWGVSLLANAIVDGLTWGEVEPPEPFMSLILTSCNASVVLGALNMFALWSYRMAVFASILAMLPCGGPCWCLGAVFGIWSLVRLMDETVKAAFKY
jgi:hypothetical protein